jgi:hypothetical protein
VPDGYRLKQDGIYIEFKNDIKYLYQKQWIHQVNFFYVYDKYNT